MPGGLFLVTVGTVVLVQITLGNMLGRLGIAGSPDHNPRDPITGFPSGPRQPGRDFNGNHF